MKHRYIAFTRGDPGEVEIADLTNAKRVQPQQAGNPNWHAWVLEFDPENPGEPERPLTDGKLQPASLSLDKNSMTTVDGLVWNRLN